MDHFTKPIRRWMSPKNGIKPGITRFDEQAAIRMSDLNHSYTDSVKNIQVTDLDDSFNKDELMSIKTNLLTSTVTQVEDQEGIHLESKSKHQEIDIKIQEKLDELDFRKFVEDLSGTQINLNNVTQELIMIKDSVISERISYPEVITENHCQTNCVTQTPRPDNKEVKVIKVKISVPKGTLQNNNFNVFNDSSHVSPNKIMNTKASGNEDINDLKNYSKNYKPIMGKSALLSKIRPKKDSEIVQELVTERFSDFLVNYYQRSFQRFNSRVHKFPEENEKTFDELFIKHSSTMNDLSIFSENVEYNNTYESIGEYKEKAMSREDNRSTTSKSTGTYQEASKIEDISEEKFNTYNLGSLGSLKNMKFILSTDEHNLETSSEVLNNSTHTLEYERTEEVEYDSQKFLKAALGEDFANISTDTQIATVNESVGTSNISALLSKASSMYSTLSRGIERLKRKNTTSLIYEDDSYSAHTEYADYLPVNKKLSDLILENNKQNQIMLQTSKALSVCKNTKEFVASVEEIEAERILLVATTKRDAIREEIRKIEYEDLNEYDIKSFGSVRLKNLTFPPKQASPHLSNVFDKRRKDFTQWFVCIVNCGSIVFATQAIRPDESGLVSFEDEFIFEELYPDFEITVAIYSMQIRNNLRNYSHESKYRLNKNVKTLCPSPQKLFTIGRETKQVKTPTDYFQPSSFTLGGKYVLRINNLRDTGNFKMTNVPLSSPLEGAVIMDLEGGIKINEHHRGFLNIGDESGERLTWNRRWCVLEGSKLFYYNYPEDDEPVDSLDLSYCVSSVIAAVDRKICAKPRTLLLETVHPTSRNDVRKSTHIVRHFLAADTIDCMRLWERKLNCTVSVLRNWNSMNCQLQYKHLVTSNFQPSSFTLGGNYVLRINNLRDTGNFKMTNVPLSSLLEGAVIMDPEGGVTIDEHHRGFLNIGDESGERLAWDRRWCVLEGSKLFYYNYPEDEKPVGSLDLSYCVSSVIAAVDRKICAKPRTLLLETVHPTGRNDVRKSTHIVRHFLAADTIDCMRLWERKLNCTVSVLRNWNSMNCQF